MYTFTCQKCGDFEIVGSPSTYKSAAKCPTCKKRTNVRNFQADATNTAFVGLVPQTVGGLSDRNADKMSKDQKIDLWYKHNSYKYDEPNKPPPPGATRVKRLPTPKEVERVI
jgi:putative FmdB family regulatory protein